MLRTIATISLFVLFSIGIVNASTLMNDYEKKLKRVEKENRSFQLPNAMILNQEISNLGMQYFLEKTGLIDNIAGRYLKESGIHMAVNLAYYDYGKYLKDNMPQPMLESATIHEEMKPVLIDAIIRVSKEVRDLEDNKSPIGNEM